MDEKIFSGKDMFDALAFKIKLCNKEMKEKNSCDFGCKCHFAHSINEVQFCKSLSDKVHNYVYEKISEHRLSNLPKENDISENKEKEIKYLKKIKDDLDDVKHINKKLLKSNKELEKLLNNMEYQQFNDNKDINKSLEELEKNSNEIKNTFKKYDYRNDSRLIIKRVRERSESPVDNKRRRSISSLNDDLDEYTKKSD